MIAKGDLRVAHPVRWVREVDLGVAVSQGAKNVAASAFGHGARQEGHQLRRSVGFVFSAGQSIFEIIEIS